jgi:hypothetical protein
MAGIIDFFDRIYLDRLFARGEDGATAFSPFGRISSAYILPRGRETDIRQALRLQIVASGIAGVSFVFLGMSMATDDDRETWFDWFGFISWFVILVAVMIYARLSLVQGLERVGDSAGSVAGRGSGET